MTERDFLKMCGLLGISATGVASGLSACSALSTVRLKPTYKVLIIGAGSAGLTAGY